jgi:hypothetical protein
MLGSFDNAKDADKDKHLQPELRLPQTGEPGTARLGPQQGFLRKIQPHREMDGRLSAFRGATTIIRKGRCVV